MAEPSGTTAVARIGLVAGPVVAVAMLAIGPPAGLSGAAWAAAAATALMAIWWMTEAVPLAATALLPVALFPLLGVATIDQASRAYAHPLIFLFLGGFILAAAVERTGLHRRLAHLLAGGGVNPRRTLAGLMVATAFLSMWISNTASAMVMLPIAKAMAGATGDPRHGPVSRPRARRDAAMMLAVAYAATIGGMATIIGTPPNALFAAYMLSSHGIAIGFAEWLALGLPLSVTLLAVAWLLLDRYAFGGTTPETAAEPDDRPPAATGPTPGMPLDAAQRRVVIVAGLTVAAWVLRPLIAPAMPALTDSGIAILAALALLAVPLSFRESRFVLTWDDVARLRWDVLVLVGGGLALAEGIAGSGLDRWIGEGVAAAGSVPLPLLLLVVMVTIVLLGELASNTAIAALFLPIAGAAAMGLGVSPLVLALPVVLAASLGFMLPVATPPNAIVYGSGLVSSRQMLQLGAILNVAGILVVGPIAVSIGPWLLTRG